MSVSDGVCSERTECFPCRTDCDKRGQVIAYPCTEMQDSVCECKTGSYLQSDSDIACEPHTICPPGHGVAIAGELRYCLDSKIQGYAGNCYKYEMLASDSF